MESLRPIAGIDYGARLAGTTVLALLHDERIRLFPMAKGQDADGELIRLIDQWQPEFLAIDAPLSVPLGIMGTGAEFHLRRADRMCGAMSPMFLGGLTARAMALRYHYRDAPITWMETYPSWMAKARFALDRKAHHLLLEQLQTLWPQTSIPIPTDQHQLDALLALAAAEYRRRHVSWHYGVPGEGVIVI